MEDSGWSGLAILWTWIVGSLREEGSMVGAVGFEDDCRREDVGPGV